MLKAKSTVLTYQAVLRKMLFIIDLISRHHYTLEYRYDAQFIASYYLRRFLKKFYWKFVALYTFIMQSLMLNFTLSC